MKFLSVLVLSMISAVCVADDAQPTLKSFSSESISVARMRLSAIKRKQEMYAQRIETTHKRLCAASFVGGAVASAGALYLGYELWCYFVPEKVNAAQEKATNDTAEVPAMSSEEKAEYERLEKDHLREWDERRSFVGRVKNSVKEGASFAFYSFIVGMIWHMISHAQNFSLAHIKQFFQEDEAWFFGGIDYDIVANIERLGVSLSRFMHDMQTWFKNHEDDEKQFKPYFCHDVIIDFSALIDSVENVLALVCESAHERLQDGQDLTIVLNQHNANLVEYLENFALFVELLLNKPIEDFEQERRRMHLYLQQCSVGIMESLRVYKRLLYVKA
ncbi:hypothetical protein IPF37_06080 [bacterium]|nr:MAG: hypothetical protein IPF37_06080 [bacterium]